MTRIVIAGGPRTGKTTSAVDMHRRIVEPDSSIDVPLRHTDDLIPLGWSEASEATAKWFAADGPWIVEGVAVPRALRKWLAANDNGKPCDVAYWLSEPHEELTAGQRGMQKGCEKVWDEIEAELRLRGVEVVLR